MGSSAVVAVGVDWSWPVVLGGLLAGLLLSWLALVSRPPMALLSVLTASAGAATGVAGLLLLTDAVDSGEIGRGGVVRQIETSPGWWLCYLALLAIGVAVQLRTSRELELRSAWERDPLRRRSGRAAHG